MAWVWDADVVLHELRRETGAPADAAPETTTWIFDPDRFAPAARLDANGALSVVTDHLGTPLCLLDEHGAAKWQGTLDAWGKASVAGDAALCPWRFPGQYEDEETGLYYNRFRYYDPGLGGYISLDPLRLLGGVVLRAYVADLVIATDTLGLATRRDYDSGAPSRARPRDPGVPELTEALKSRGIGVREHLEGLTIHGEGGRPLTDLDIVSDIGVVQVKTGGGKGALAPGFEPTDDVDTLIEILRSGGRK